MRDKYLAKRTELLTNLQNLLNEGKMEEFAATKKEIEQLDANYEVQAAEQANLNALKDNAVGKDVFTNAAGIGTKERIGEGSEEDLSNSMEYRKAFMNYVTQGIEIPAKFSNANANTKTTDVGSVIPQTVLAKIIEKMEATGMILPLVTKTAYKGGVSIPTSTVKPVATWVAEGVGSDRQKKTTGSITFGAYKLRCAISNSLEVDVMALAVFETTFINNVVDAMTKALEQSILTGTGVGQPKGFLTETVAAGQNIDIAKAAAIDYNTLLSAEAALPLAYENDAVWFMTKKTFMQFVGIVDNNKQPIARVNYGIAGRPERTLLGRTVILNDYMTTLDPTGATTHIFAALFNPADYVLNSNLNMTIKKYEDNETDDMVTKAIMLVDGKTVDVNSLVTLTKKNA